MGIMSARRMSRRLSSDRCPRGTHMSRTVAPRAHRVNPPSGAHATAARCRGPGRCCRRRAGRRLRARCLEAQSAVQRLPESGRARVRHDAAGRVTISQLMNIGSSMYSAYFVDMTSRFRTGRITTDGMCRALPRPSTRCATRPPSTASSRRRTRSAAPRRVRKLARVLDDLAVVGQRRRRANSSTSARSLVTSRIVAATAPGLSAAPAPSSTLGVIRRWPSRRR